jgi:hypothetical protein
MDSSDDLGELVAKQSILLLSIKLSVDSNILMALPVVFLTLAAAAKNCPLGVKQQSLTHLCQELLSDC